jgi:hypothetical protein
MNFRRTFASSALIALLVTLPLAADWPVTEKLDLDAIYRLQDEGLQRSKVMEIESYLTDVYGPRLTETAEHQKPPMGAEDDEGVGASERAPQLSGRGWQNQRLRRAGRRSRPPASSAVAYPAWAPGTGPVSGEAVMAVITTEKDFDTFRGKLRGKFVLATPLRGDAAVRGARPATPTPSSPISPGSRPPGADAGAATRRTPASRAAGTIWMTEGVAAVLDASR